MKINFEQEQKDKVCLLAPLFFNNNGKNTVVSIMEASISNNNYLTFNNRSISVPDLYEHAKSCVKWRFVKYLGANSQLKPEFITNFYLLKPDLQEQLLITLDKINRKYGVFFSGSKNLCAYVPKDNGLGELDFYINITGSVGKTSVYKYLSGLHDFNCKLKFENSSLPSSTVFISRWLQFKNRFFTEPIQDEIYSKMLQILCYRSDVDCFEVDVKDLKLICDNI